MDPHSYSKHLKVQFGAFEFDTRRQELRRQGHVIKLPAAQLRLLNLFLARPGELITRDEITSRLWVDSRTIDVSDGINTSINRLRSNLSDPRNSAAYIETVIGLGYRFVVEVTADSAQAIELGETSGKSQAQHNHPPTVLSDSNPPVDPTPVRAPLGSSCSTHPLAPPLSKSSRSRRSAFPGHCRPTCAAPCWPNKVA